MPSISFHQPNCRRSRERTPYSSLSNKRPARAACDNHAGYRGRTMGPLMVVGVVALATFMYNSSIMQRVDIKSVENALHRNLHCQQAAIRALTGYITDYTEQGYGGVVLLHLTGAEGSGKTLTLDTLRNLNPTWKKIVGSHEEGDLNKMSQEQLIATVHSGIHASTLNFLFFDDVPGFAEDAPFVDTMLKPILRAFKFEEALLFVVITSYKGMTKLPWFLRNEFEHQTILYEPLSRSCVKECVVDALKTLGMNRSDLDMGALMNRFSFDVVDGVQVSEDGCKRVYKTVALFFSKSATYRD